MSARQHALNERFSNLDKSIQFDGNARFAERVLIASQGAQTIASIMRNNLNDLASIADGDNTRPLLNAYEIGTLAGLMILSLEQITSDAERRIKALEAAVNIPPARRSDQTGDSR